MDKLQNVNYDVLNSLNLMSRSLGDAYLLEGYNPFDEDYVLDLENSRKLITNLKQKENIEAEEFLENSDLNILENFQTAKQNAEALLAELSTLPQNKKVKGLKVFLKNRSKLLSAAIEKMQNGDLSAFELYREIEGLDVEYSKLLRRSYYKDFDLKVTIQNFMNLLNLHVLAPAKTQQKAKALAQEKTVVKESASQTPQISKKTPQKQKESGLEM
jgi:hypothetical protein